jgi:hypothetical protein
VLICDRGVLRIATLDGTTVRELAPREIRLGSAPRDQVEPTSLARATFVDGRWLRDGRIMAIDLFGLPVQFTMQGAPYSDPVPPPNPWRIDHASLADHGDAYVLFDGHALLVHATDPTSTYRWRLINEKEWYRLPLGPKSTAVMAGNSVAITYWTMAVSAAQPSGYGWCVLDVTTKPFTLSVAITYWTMAVSAAQPSGYGWCVLDVTTKPFTLSGSWEAPILDRDWIHGGEAPPVFDFDRKVRRMAIASQAPVGSGVIRLAPLLERGHARTSAEPRSAELAGAQRVALDDQGARVVYGFPGTRELRFDYLAPQATGPRSVDVIDSQRIDPGIDVVAFAFDPPGHQLACLGSGGDVVIVPVP